MDEFVCTCNRGAEGFTFDVDLGLWVHSTCGRPTRGYLDAMYDLEAKR